MLIIEEGKYWLQSGSLGSDLPKSVAVAWSGGADSTALLLALKSSGFDVQAWHVDHAWRASSLLEAECLKQQAQAWGIPFLQKNLVTISTKNREAEARQGRYQAFQQFAQESGVHSLCLGHHRDEQAETVYMRMLQGAGILGCRGMRSEHQLANGLTLFRPLLHVSSTEIRRVLSEHQITWFEDPSNTDLSLWRNRIRQQIFPRMQQQGYDPASLFSRWQQQATHLSEKIEQWVRQVDINVSDEGCSICWSQWRELPAVVRAYVLQRMMSQLFGDGVVAGRRHLLEIEAWTGRGGKGGLDLSRCRLMRQHGRLLLGRVQHTAS